MGVVHTGRKDVAFHSEGWISVALLLLTAHRTPCAASSLIHPPAGRGRRPAPAVGGQRRQRVRLGPGQPASGTAPLHPTPAHRQGALTGTAHFVLGSVRLFLPARNCLLWL